ncbi:hypothetical protein EV702DRAFT_1083946 [Suillus placidus]|uniref:Uncharacterized protein n=1 Tax=Suillus placidus TaxID=48579 RepID=A0A9P7D5L9_9AGAM|nr:hypothetical protein EV702DRAFT_1083946 [Suillus placidus]
MRNTIWGDESIPNLLAHPLINVDKQTVQQGRTMSTRTLGLRAVVPHGMESACAFVATLDTAQILPPPSAASTVTLFDPMAEFDPAAQSTPLHEKTIISHENINIVYIRSSEEHAQAPTEPEAQPPTKRNNANGIVMYTRMVVLPGGETTYTQV